MTKRGTRKRKNRPRKRTRKNKDKEKTTKIVVSEECIIA